MADALASPVPDRAGFRILAVDPALRNTGYAVLEKGSAGIRALAYGTIRNHPKLLQSGCLVATREALDVVIRKHRPDACAVESVIFVQSYKTAIVLGAARGAALIAAAEHGLPIHEYAPRRVKMAVVGRGAADKQQVAFMMRALLGLSETPEPDAADALAIAMTHFHAMDPARAALAGGGTRL